MLDFQCAIFDLDGTLLDSMPVWDHLAEHYLLQNGRTPAPDLRATLAAMDMRESADYLISTYSLSTTPETLMDDMNALAMTAYRTSVQPKPGVPAYLAALRARGVRLAIATATDRPPVEAALRRLSLLQYFDTLFTCTEVGKSKRHPDIFLAAMHALGGSLANTVVFEDSLHAIRTAKSAGFRVIAIPDASAAHDRAEIKRLADVWFNSYAEALSTLQPAEGRQLPSRGA